MEKIHEEIPEVKKRKAKCADKCCHYVKNGSLLQSSLSWDVHPCSYAAAVANNVYNKVHKWVWTLSENNVTVFLFLHGQGFLLKNYWLPDWKNKFTAKAWKFKTVQYLRELYRFPNPVSLSHSFTFQRVVNTYLFYFLPREALFTFKSSFSLFLGGRGAAV